MAYSILKNPGEIGLARSPIFFYVYDGTNWENDNFYYFADVYVWSGALVADKPTEPTLRLSRYPDAKHGAAFDVGDVCNAFLDEHIPRENGALFTHGVAWCYVEFGYSDSNTGEHLAVTHFDAFPVVKGWSKYTDGLNYDPTLEDGKARWLTDRADRIRIFDGCYFTLALPYKSATGYGVPRVRIWDDGDGASKTYRLDTLIGTADNSNERVLLFQCGLGTWLTDDTNLGAKVSFDGVLAPVREYYVQGVDTGGLPVTKKFTFEIVSCAPWGFVTLQFLNRYGVWDYLICEGRRRDSLAIEAAEVFRNPLSIQEGAGVTLDSDRGQYYVEVQAREAFTINTGWLAEEDNELVRQLLVSKRVLIGESDGKTYQPVTVKMTDWTEQTVRGDKLINYELSLRYANDYINTVK